MKLKGILFLIFFSVLIGNVFVYYSVSEELYIYEYVTSNDDSLEENTELFDEEVFVNNENINNYHSFLSGNILIHKISRVVSLSLPIWTPPQN